jgi:hypothetical protein
MKTLLEMAAADWGRPLELTARAAGAVLALVIALVLIAGDGLVAVARLAHVALLERSDQLAVLVVRLVAPEHRRPALAALASLPAPAAAAPTPPALAALTVAALRRRARNRGLAAAGGRPVHKARRADLLEALAIA